ncbi:MAG TPA: hypothetical protein VFS05_10355 [Gemmatimonadaceae bacterium]|nr:hypothetical protein [Gemmatimonadaceae bacterium]
MTAPLAALRARLATVVASPTAGGALPTGIAPLDAALHGHGLPRGRLTEIVGARGSGRTTMLRSLVAATLRRRMWVAYVDAGRTLAPRDWARVGERGEGLWVVRPPSPARAAWCADVLLRSGAFALVVLDGAPRLAQGVAVRLGRLARETGAALVVTADAEEGSAMLPAALRLRVERARTDTARRPAARGAASPRPAAARTPSARSPSARSPSARSAAATASPGARRAIAITVEKGGLRRRVEVGYDIGVASRLCTHPEVGDRRGRRGGDGTRAADGGGAAGAALARPGAGGRAGRLVRHREGGARSRERERERAACGVG